MSSRNQERKASPPRRSPNPPRRCGIGAERQRPRPDRHRRPRRPHCLGARRSHRTVMKVTKRGEYALRALIALAIAREAGRDLLPLKEIAALDISEHGENAYND
jgi:hypothetical protein